MKKVLLASIIRTLVPIAVGQIVAWLALASVILDQATKDALGTVLGGLITAVYYLLIRLLEQRWPAIGVLLGLAQSPDSYSKEPDPNFLTATLNSAGTWEIPGKPDVVTWDHIDVADGPPTETTGGGDHSANRPVVINVADVDPAAVQRFVATRKDFDV